MRRADTLEIDVRQIAPAVRHAYIFSRFDDLAEGAELTLFVDHEPRPLHHQFMASRAGCFMWAQHFSGADLWTVRIRRVAPQADDLSAFLARCPLLSELEQSARERLARSASESAFERNAAIAEQGRAWPYLAFVRQGVVSAILASPYGREQTLYEVLATEAFNEIVLVDAGAAVARFVASTSNVRVVLVPVAAVETLLAEQRLFRAVAALSAQRQRSVIERLAALLSLPIVARVATALLPYAQPAGGFTPVLAPLDSMTQVQLAAAAGTVKEVLNRALAELEAAGALRRRSGRITELNRAVLTACAQAQ